MVRLVPRAVRVLVAARVTIVRRPDLAIARFDSKDNLRIGLVRQSTSAVEQLRPYHCRVLAISDEEGTGSCKRRRRIEGEPDGRRGAGRDLGVSREHGPGRRQRHRSQV